MTIKDILKEKDISVYQLAKQSGLPYTTVRDICNGRTRLEKCSAETVYKIADTLNVSMEELLAPYLEKRISFENFKSAVCHRVKTIGDIKFILETLKSNEIRIYFNREWYPESLYLLAMVDYLSRENNVPLDSDYDDIRKYKLDRIIYPAGIRAMSVFEKNEDVLKEEFLGCHPCINTSSLALSMADMREKLLAHLGVEPLLVDLPDDRDAES